MKQSEFLQIAGLAALRVPDDPEERDAFLKARTMLSTFASRVRGSEAPAASDEQEAEHQCPLRDDETREGLPEDAAFDGAPEHGERLIQVPGVL